MKKAAKTTRAKARENNDDNVRIVNILGTDYTIEGHTAKEDPKLEMASGYCDPSVKKVVILKDPDASIFNAENVDTILKATLRHELIHCFFEESAINENYLKESEELIVEWIALQFPKMLKVFKEVGAL